MISNNPALIGKSQFYLMESNFREVEEVDLAAEAADVLVSVEDLSGAPLAVAVQDDLICATGDFVKAAAETRDQRYSLFGNEGLVFRAVLKALERNHGIYSLHASAIYNTQKEELNIIAGGAASGKTALLLKGLEAGFQVFSTELVHFEVRAGALNFYKGALKDNIRLGSLKYDYPEAAGLLDVTVPDVEDVWGTKVTADMSAYQTPFDEIENPAVNLVFSRVESGRSASSVGELRDARVLTKLLFDNISEKPGSAMLLYECLPVPAVDDAESAERRLRHVRLFLEKATVGRAFKLLAGAQNCLEELL